MRRLLILIALVAGTLFPAAGAFGTALTAAQTDPTGIGIRLVDAPVATRDNPRASAYIIDHVKPGTTIERRIDVSNDTGKRADVAVYPAAAAITQGSFVGLEEKPPTSSPPGPRSAARASRWWEAGSPSPHPPTPATSTRSPTR